MFSAMISRPIVLLAVLILAFAAGWGIYELRFGRGPDAPPIQTDGPVPERMAGQGGGKQVPEPMTEASPNIATPADRGGGDVGSETGSPADRVPAAPRPDAELSRAQVERSGQGEPAGSASGEPARMEQPEPGGQVEASPRPEQPETAPPTSTQPEPSATAGLAKSPGSEAGAPQAEHETPTAPPGRAAIERSSPPLQAPQADAAPEQAAEAHPAARTAADPPAPPRAPVVASAPDASEPLPQAEGGEDAAPATSAEQVGSAPAETRAAADPATAPSAAPGASEAPARQGDKEVADEPRPATARVAETIRRAVAALFGAGIDDPAAGGEEGESATRSWSRREPVGADSGSGATGDEPETAPSFDIVRVKPDGQAVIAGRAAPGAEVELRSGDRTIDRVRADQRGEWVALPPEPLGAGVQELSLAARLQDQPAVASEEVVVVAVPEAPHAPAPQAAADPPASGPAQVAAAHAADEPFAVALPRQGAGKGRILQAPGRISTDGALALVMLDYDEAGRIRLSGEADAGAALRIYVDNQPAGTAVAGPGGKWDAVLQRNLTPGDYTLRLDQLDPSGRPDARLETPFTRVSHPPVEGDVQVDYVIVQPGNSLWRIARRVLGEGMRYVHIYQANQMQIRDPDLIYPGQVFELPSGSGAAG